MATYSRNSNQSPRGPQVRKGSFRLDEQTSNRIKQGHSWIYREEVPVRAIDRYHGKVVTLLDDKRQFLAHAIADGSGPVCARVISYNKMLPPLEELMATKIKQAWARRIAFMPENYQDTAFRVLNGDSEGIPSVTIDFYGGFIIVQFYSESMAGMGKYIYPALESIVKPIGCYEQRRFKSLGGKAPEQKGATHQFGAAAPVEFSVSEHGLKFLVDVTSPLSTGLFTDLRAGRDLVRRHAKNRNVLNLFSYTGAFSVYAHAGGAASITSVDTAPKGHARSRKNFAANGMEEDACQYMVADARAQLAKFKSRDRFFDLTIVDPPAFGSPVKRGQQPWVAMRDYADVVADVLAVTSPNGFVFAVSSTHKMSEEHYRSALSDAALKAKRQIHTLETVKLPWDYLVHPSFPEGDYLKATLLIVD